ncbi:MAG: hypothetical protein KF689_09045 [Gemmatimonadaceae bacterium]|nr:hypothetical protein [Gemmatimonadaceae bacterium]MCW5826257.1 hypothetical protein [Gemmatimonadaceae bacterium]
MPLLHVPFDGPYQFFLALGLDVSVGERFTMRVSSRRSDAEASRSFLRAGASWHVLGAPR